jgi:molybdate transport system substrate-binding protein
VKGLVVLLAAVVLVGCSSSGGSSSPNSSGSLTGAITVYAAASLTEAFDTLQGDFEKAHPGTDVKITYGASSDLSTQIDQGASVDVFASASKKNMDALGDEVDTPTDFVSNTGELAVPPSNPANVKSVQDLDNPGVKVAVCDPAVPCGVIAQTIFDNAKITVKPVANEADVKSTLAAVESGEVDAGIVYVTDVRAAGAKVMGIVVPDDINASTTYPIATVTAAPNPSLAKAWVDYVLSPAGEKVLTAAGFAQP